MATPKPALRWAAWMFALAPVALAAAVHWGRPSVPLAIAAPERPALAFDQYLVDLGPIQPTSEVRGVFHFRNRGKEAVTLTKVVPSCGCLQPLVSGTSIPAGEAGRIALRMLPANEMPGKKEYFADVEYADPEPRTARLTFRLELPERQLLVRPRALLFYQFSDAPTTQELIVSDTRDTPAKILEVTDNSPFVEVELKAQRPGEAGGQETVIQVTVAGTLPSERKEAIVTIRTDDPNSPELRVPLLLQGGKIPEAQTPKN